MRNGITNWILMPVFTLSIACSLAQGGMDLSKLARKVSAPCPLHMAQETPADESGHGAGHARRDTPRCLNCVSSSIRTEDRLEILAPAATDVFLAAQLHTVPLFHAPVLRAGLPIAEIDSGPPRITGAPLRI